ncbi:hypothetical protein [uncultured Paraglaciecola sp.]|jgi:hypothetical protein|uniref:hypothetical protein n=1 Tax=uncultured Paraglaciecola sp. TaxID=1765024 RepID=UPI0026229121|nr:hypothetical protein [uncultured Paraglaciecola sp.]
MSLYGLGKFIEFTKPIYSTERATSTASSGIHWVDLVWATLNEEFENLKQVLQLIEALASAT